jgi:hypothetical protein
MLGRLYVKSVCTDASLCLVDIFGSNRAASVASDCSEGASSADPPAHPQLKRQRTSTSIISMDAHGQMEVAGLGFDEEASDVIANARRELLTLKGIRVQQQGRDTDAIADAVFAVEAAANAIALPSLSQSEP